LHLPRQRFLCACSSKTIYLPNIIHDLRKKSSIFQKIVVFVKNTFVFLGVITVIMTNFAYLRPIMKGNQYFFVQNDKSVNSDFHQFDTNKQQIKKFTSIYF